MNILSIQSHVAYGHVGNASAVFPLQRLGHEVWPVNTVQFSNHTGYGAWRGQVFGRDLIDDCVAGIDERGVLPSCDGVLSGYMGSADIGEAILDAVARVRAANPNARYACDPVIGDVGRGVFVRPGIPEFLRSRALPAADLVTPNQFELEYLTAAAATDRASAKAAVARLHAMGPSVVMVTSLQTAETPADCLDALASDGTTTWIARSPRLPIAVNGAGDAIAALFFVHWLETRSAGVALSRAVSSVFGLLKRTADAGSREILTIAAQDEFVAPSRIIAAEPI
jgi:pyridoxine kinase